MNTPALPLSPLNRNWVEPPSAKEVTSPGPSKGGVGVGRPRKEYVEAILNVADVHFSRGIARRANQKMAAVAGVLDFNGAAVPKPRGGKIFAAIPVRPFYSRKPVMKPPGRQDDAGRQLCSKARRGDIPVRLS